MHCMCMVVACSEAEELLGCFSSLHFLSYDRGPRCGMMMVDEQKDGEALGRRAAMHWEITGGSGRDSRAFMLG